MFLDITALWMLIVHCMNFNIEEKEMFNAQCNVLEEEVYSNHNKINPNLFTNNNIVTENNLNKFYDLIKLKYKDQAKMNINEEELNILYESFGASLNPLNAADFKPENSASEFMLLNNLHDEDAYKYELEYNKKCPKYNEFMLINNLDDWEDVNELEKNKKYTRQNEFMLLNKPHDEEEVKEYELEKNKKYQKHNEFMLINNLHDGEDVSEYELEENKKYPRHNEFSKLKQDRAFSYESGMRLNDRPKKIDVFKSFEAIPSNTLYQNSETPKIWADNIANASNKSTNVNTNLMNKSFKGVSLFKNVGSCLYNCLASSYSFIIDNMKGVCRKTVRSLGR